MKVLFSSSYILVMFLITLWDAPSALLMPSEFAVCFMIVPRILFSAKRHWCIHQLPIRLSEGFKNDSSIVAVHARTFWIFPTSGGWYELTNDPINDGILFCNYVMYPIQPLFTDIRIEFWSQTDLMIYAEFAYKNFPCYFQPKRRTGDSSFSSSAPK